MKLSGRNLASFFEAPPKGVMGVLIYGNDSMRVASKREKLIHAILGPNANEEMRLARISRENLKKSPEQAIDLCKACLLYTSPSPRDGLLSRMPSSA